MSKTLGIPWDMWHGVIPAVVMPVVIGISVGIFGASQLTFLLTGLCLVVVLTLLQYVNELIQSKGDVVKEYGSVENFEKNSKKDWGWFIIGSVIGGFLSFATFVIMDKVL
jgi:uncharacterized membrane protein